MSGDPWKNRSQMMLCGACMYYVGKAPDNGSLSPIGRCRRSAPTMKGFPIVMVNDWCGDHRLDENKVSVQPPAGKKEKRPDVPWSEPKTGPRSPTKPAPPHREAVPDMMKRDKLVNPAITATEIHQRAMDKLKDGVDASVSDNAHPGGLSKTPIHHVETNGSQDATVSDVAHPPLHKLGSEKNPIDPMDPADNPSPRAG